MDEEVAVKVTRLRRRLSTEADGALSPATPSTPNKKRATKLAKPVLELIDENVTENGEKGSSQQTKDEEATENKPVTPARRSTRIRSNTSLLLEATQKLASDSPRAIRALRRNSQIGSDTESTSTPTRRTRSRKNSTSSVEILPITSNEKMTVQVAEAISEEPDKEVAKDSKQSLSQNTTPLRKSPRLNKSQNTPNEQQKDDKNKPEQNDNDSKMTNDSKSSINKENNTTETDSNSNDSDKNKSKDLENKNLSPSSAKLISEINTNPKKSTDSNKTVSAIEESNESKNTKKRTKSLNNIAVDVPTENNFASGDNITEKKDIKTPNKSDKSTTKSLKENKENIDLLKSTQSLSASDTIKVLANNTPVKGIQPVIFMEDSDSNSGKLVMDEQNDGEHAKSEAGDQCVPVVKQATPKRLTSESFVVEPMDIDETIPENVTFNDFSDKSNSSKDEVEEPASKHSSPKLNFSSVNKSANKSTRVSISLQQEMNNSKRKSSIGHSQGQNDSKDALDKSTTSEKSKLSISILYENSNFGDKSKRKSSLSKADVDKRKSSSCSQIEEKVNESSNKSKRKSVSETESQNQEKTSNENKSTLVLSQLKDMSANDSTSELSKSVNMPTKDMDKKIQSLNYLTSTPLQQKPLQKLGMQINSSIISPNVESKNTSKAKNNSKTSMKNVSNISQDSDSSEDEDSRDKNSMVDDEAEEASDGYKSGDSRNEEEKQYEKDHEISEQGETLESEPEVSDDSDYEKDSFVVSSNEEDNELLSGSDDDLSDGDKELEMTAKSKKKFDERKRKEQKNASKEMYAARHQLNKSDKSNKSKSKEKKLESSASESETEERQPKKKNRMRIDSSQDNVNDASTDSTRVKKKKVNRLSESVSEDNTNEKEITIQNQSMAEKSDPLAGGIKQEPKTPVKEFNMSTVAINDNIEQVQVDANASVFKSNETSDPLQNTSVQEDDESDSDISENMEIKENYDSVLENLNKSNNKLKNISDAFLNLNKKAKNKIKEPIIDQLNLTQTKSKKNKAKETQTAKESLQNDKENKEEEFDCSDSIDMKLLFSEDSNDSESIKSNNKFKLNNDKEQEEIPLKRTGAKTNLLENNGESECFFIDTKGAYDSDESTQDKDSKKSNQKQDVEPTDYFAASENSKKKKSLSASMITEDAAFEETVDVSMNSEKKKKKNKSQLDMSQKEEPEETLTNVSITSEKKKKKNKSLLDVSQINEDAASEEIVDSVVNKKKNKNKSQLDLSHTVEDTVVEEAPVDVSMSSAKKKKKNKSLLDVSQVTEDTAPEETSVNISVQSDKKKKKNKSLLGSSQIAEDAEVGESPADSSMSSAKKKKKNKSLLDVSQVTEDTAAEETPADISTSSSKKKKKNKSLLDSSQIADVEAPEDIQVNISVNSEKKKKKNKSFETLQVEDIDTEEAIVNVSQGSNKKKKKLLEAAVIDATEVEEANVSGTTQKKKKKNKQIDFFQIIDNAGDESDGAPEEISFKKSDVIESEEDDDTNTKSKNKFKKKKKKSKKVQPETDESPEQNEVKAKKRKHDQSSEANDAHDMFNFSTSKKKTHFEYDDSGNPIQGSTKKPKKRKATDDDIPRDPKVFKGNSFDNINVPRLPDSIVSQLEDQPKIAQSKRKNKRDSKKKGFAISTLPFEVEEGPRRKNKPSNYLEQSVYLNDSISPPKPKKIIKNPKVLPFTPTVITSGKGFTSNFKINVLPQETQFVAQASNIPNFRDKYLSKQRKRKLKVATFKSQKDRLTKF